MTARSFAASAASVESVVLPGESVAGDRARGGSLDDLRRRNLGSVLRVAHLRGDCSRADITRDTGLNRSTVKGLVADLVAANILIQGRTEKSGTVGRPSPVVCVSDAVKVLAINPEVDSTAGALVGLNGQVFARAQVSHDSSPSSGDVVAATGELLRTLAPTGELRGIGVAVPGLVDAKSGTVVVAPHLGWQDVALADLLRQAYGFPVVVDNDANCGVVAEALFGAGRGRETIVYLNGGASGIGGSVARGGSLVAGTHGYGGEFGHILVNSLGERCHCGADGCLETEVTRSRLLAALGDVPVAQLDEELLRCSAINSARSRIEHAANSDAGRLVAAELDRQMRYLAIAARTVVNITNPERLILGGFLASMLNACGMDAIDTELRRALPGARDDMQVVTAELGRDILAVGAAELVLRDVIADPLSTRTAVH